MIIIYEGTYTSAYKRGEGYYIIYQGVVKGREVSSLPGSVKAATLGSGTNWVFRNFIDQDLRHTLNRIVQYDEEHVKFVFPEQRHHIINDVAAKSMVEEYLKIDTV